MTAKNIVSPDEVKELFFPEELGEMDSNNSASDKQAPDDAAQPYDTAQLQQLVQTIHALQSQINELQTKVDKLECLLPGQAAALETAADGRCEDEGNAPCMESPESNDGRFPYKPEPGGDLPLIPRAVRHGKKKQGLRKFF